MTELFNGGLVTKRTGDLLENGELQAAQNAYYQPGDARRIWKLRKPAVLGDTGTGARVDGLAALEFDDGTDLLVALSNGTLYRSTLGVPNKTFSTLKSGLSTTGTHLSAAAYQNRGYLVNGVDRGVVVRDNGVVRDMGMLQPSSPPEVSVQAGSGSNIRPTSSSSTFLDPGNAYDADLETFAYAVVLPAASLSETYSFTSSAVTSGTRLVVTYTTAGDGGGSPGFSGTGQPRGEDPFDGAPGGGQAAKGTLLIEVSEDGGSSYNTVIERTISGSQGLSSAQADISDSLTINTSIRVRISHTHAGGDNSAHTLRVHDVRLNDGATGDPFDATIQYGTVEAVFNEDGFRDVLSPISDGRTATFEAASLHNQAQITKPPTRNSAATHWIIYRTQNAGTYWLDAGEVAVLPVTQSTYVDDFETYAPTVQPPRLYPRISLQATSGEGAEVLAFSRDAPPPVLAKVFSFQNSLVGIPAGSREVRYTPPGYPESWPELYVLRASTDENDTLVTGLDIGGTAMIWTSNTAFRLDALPLTSEGSFSTGTALTRLDFPGCLGVNAATTGSIQGEVVAFWASREGLHWTNGYRYEELALDIDWASIVPSDVSNVALFYSEVQDAIEVLTGTASYRIHLRPELRKQNGQPRWTGPNEGAFSQQISAAPGGISRVYGSHVSDGKVYIKEYATGGTFRIKSRRLISDGADFSALRADLRHGDFGEAETAVVDWTVGRDDSSVTATKSQVVGLAGNKRDRFDVARGGEWHEYEITHTGNGAGALHNMDVQFRRTGSSGKVSI